MSTSAEDRIFEAHMTTLGRLTALERENRVARIRIEHLRRRLAEIGYATPPVTKAHLSEGALDGIEVDNAFRDHPENTGALDAGRGDDDVT